MVRLGGPASVAVDRGDRTTGHSRAPRRLATVVVSGNAVIANGCLTLTDLIEGSRHALTLTPSHEKRTLPTNVEATVLCRTRRSGRSGRAGNPVPSRACADARPIAALCAAMRAGRSSISMISLCRAAHARPAGGTIETAIPVHFLSRSGRSGRKSVLYTSRGRVMTATRGMP